MQSVHQGGIMYVRELTVRYKRRRISGTPPLPQGPLTSPTVAATMFIRLLGHEAVEVCGLLCLTAGLEPNAYHELSRGTIDHAIVMPRDVFRIALLAHAKSIVISHNHPTGSVEPSPPDVDLTRTLVSAATLIGVELLDHIIVSADGRYYSFKEMGRL
jgi:DNA repair protein RadC